jgi:hypothetical protein
VLTPAGSRRGVLLVAIGLLLLVGATPAEASNRHRYNNGDPILWAHWGDGAGGGPGFVTLADFTGDNWPVYAAAIEWDFAGHLNVIYHYGGCGGHGHCADVRDQDFGVSCNQVGGRFNLERGSNNHATGENSYIRVNTRCNYHSNREQRVITC